MLFCASLLNEQVNVNHRVRIMRKNDEQACDIPFDDVIRKLLTHLHPADCRWSMRSVPYAIMKQ